MSDELDALLLGESASGLAGLAERGWDLEAGDVGSLSEHLSDALDRFVAETGLPAPVMEGRGSSFNYDAADMEAWQRVVRQRQDEWGKGPPYVQHGTHRHPVRDGQLGRAYAFQPCEVCGGTRLVASIGGKIVPVGPFVGLVVERRPSGLERWPAGLAVIQPGQAAPCGDCGPRHRP